MKQASFAELAYTHKKKTTRQEKFLKRDGCNFTLATSVEADIEEVSQTRPKHK